MCRMISKFSKLKKSLRATKASLSIRWASFKWAQIKQFIQSPGNDSANLLLK